MTGILERLNQWNQRMNGLPRKAMLVTVTLLLTWLFVLTVPLCWPLCWPCCFPWRWNLLCAYVLPASKKSACPAAYGHCWAMTLLFGILGVAAFTLFQRLLRELLSLAHSAPVFVNWVAETAIPYVRNLYLQYSDILPATVMNVVNSALSLVGRQRAAHGGHSVRYPYERGGQRGRCYSGAC